MHIVWQTKWKSIIINGPSKNVQVLMLNAKIKGQNKNAISFIEDNGYQNKKIAANKVDAFSSIHLLTISEAVA